MGKSVKDILYTCTNINVLVIILPVGGPGGGIATKNILNSVTHQYNIVAIMYLNKHSLYIGITCAH